MFSFADWSMGNAGTCFGKNLPRNQRFNSEIADPESPRNVAVLVEL